MKESKFNFVNEQRKRSFDNLKVGKCNIIMQEDSSGNIKKYDGSVRVLSNGQKVVFCTTPSDDTHTVIDYTQRGSFIKKGPFDYSIYETNKSLVRNEIFYDNNGSPRVRHFYTKKTDNKVNLIKDKFGAPTLITRRGKQVKIWH